MIRLILNSFLVGAVLLQFSLVKASTIYDLTIEDHQGNEVSLKKFYGKVTLIVNVASYCGYTDGTYKALTRLHDILSHGDYFSVLAFPCNQFGEQEPDDISEIVEAMKTNYEIEFPIFNKINVVGSENSPLFKALIDQSNVVPDWNFYKYLVDWKGEVINAWRPSTTIEEIFEEIQVAVEKAKQLANSTAKSAEVEGKEEKLHSKEETKDEL